MTARFTIAFQLSFNGVGLSSDDSVNAGSRDFGGGTGQMQGRE